MLKDVGPALTQECRADARMTPNHTPLAVAGVAPPTVAVRVPAQPKVRTTAASCSGTQACGVLIQTAMSPPVLVATRAEPSVKANVLPLLAAGVAPPYPTLKENQPEVICVCAQCSETAHRGVLTQTEMFPPRLPVALRADPSVVLRVFVFCAVPSMLPSSVPQVNVRVAVEGVSATI